MLEGPTSPRFSIALDFVVGIEFLVRLRLLFFPFPFLCPLCTPVAPTVSRLFRQ